MGINLSKYIIKNQLKAYMLKIELLHPLVGVKALLDMGSVFYSCSIIAEKQTVM